MPALGGSIRLEAVDEQGWYQGVVVGYWGYVLVILIKKDVQQQFCLLMLCSGELSGWVLLCGVLGRSTSHMLHRLSH